MSLPATKPVRPLVDGERLAPEAFDLRYEASPDIRKAELIRGVVHVASPTSHQHGRPHAALIGELYTFARDRDDLELLDAPTIHLANGARAEPDAVLRRTGSDAGSRVEGEGAAGRIHGAPELLAEVSLATAARDLDDTHGKMADYRESGVLEYLVVLPETREVQWWHLTDGAYELLPSVDGVTESRAFPGLRIEAERLFPKPEAPAKRSAELSARRGARPPSTDRDPDIG